jgi:hypothetical protein
MGTGNQSSCGDAFSLPGAHEDEENDGLCLSETQPIIFVSQRDKILVKIEDGRYE